MLDENSNQIPEDRENREARPLSPLEKKILAIGGIVVLMAGSFFVGRFTAPAPSTPNPFNPPSQPLSTAAAPVTVSPLQLTMINFDGVSPVTMDAVMTLYNMKQCACGCKMSVAECVIKDPNCPMWKDHVTEIQKSLGNHKKPNLSMAGHTGLAMPGGFPTTFGPSLKMVPPPSKPQ